MAAEGVVAEPRNLGFRQAGSALVFFGLAAVLLVLALSGANLAIWQRALLGAVGLYLIFAGLNNQRGLRAPPRIGPDGLYLYRRGDLNFLMHAQHLPWSQVQRVRMLPSGLVWIEHTPAAGPARRDPLATQTFRNGPAVRQALRDGAAGHGLPLDDAPEAGSTT